MRLIGLVLLLISNTVLARTPSIAFYYGQIDSVRELLTYDRVVLPPDAITSRQLSMLHDGGVKVFAYLSVGEYEGGTLPDNLLEAQKHTNTGWNSKVMDLTSQQWQKFLANRASDYAKRHFDGLFLDTLDSYSSWATQNMLLEQEKALVTTIGKIKSVSGNKPLILNRGFNVVPKLGFKPYAVAAESLYHGYNANTGKYYTVSESDTAWLVNKLNGIKKLGSEVIAIDYIPASERKNQVSDAKRILKLGYTPYVSDGLLNQFGVSTVTPVARRVLGFYDSRYSTMTTSSCHRMLATAIEYQGYIPECRDVRALDFTHLDNTRYASSALWLDARTYNEVPKLVEWIDRSVGELPLVFFYDLPSNGEILEKLGISRSKELTGTLKVIEGKKRLEGHYPLPSAAFDPLTAYQVTTPGAKVLIQVSDSTGNKSDLMFKTSWGGAVLAPLPVLTLANGKEAWLIDPFKTIDALMPLPVIPAPDVTTESGRRIFTSHIDGDGFPSKAWMPGKPYSAEPILEGVLKKYNVPHTVSVIEGEVGPDGMYPKESPAMEAIARKMFALPNVEIASHTFSHPFFWDDRIKAKDKQYGDSLPIPGYKLDYTREIDGTVNYINKELAPKGKKVVILLWSGTADPIESMVRRVSNLGLLNVNGGNTYVVKGDDSLTQVSPTIAWYPSAVQVYAPVINENLYTNLWTEHHDGFGRAKETFELLGEPRRLKPVSIYYHMYSGVYPTSLHALQSLYDWSAKQPLIPLHLSDYARRARRLYTVGIGQDLDGKWVIHSAGVTNIRLPDTLGYPTRASKGIAGWSKGPDGNYIQLSHPQAKLSLTQKEEKYPRLDNAMGMTEKWDHKDKNIHFSFKSYVPFSMTLKNANQCKLVSNKPLKRKVLNKQTVVYSSAASGVFSGTLSCR